MRDETRGDRARCCGTVQAGDQFEDRGEGRCYRAGFEIICHADSGRDVYFILSGRVKASLLTVSGKVVIFQELGRGEMFGELSAIDGAPRSTSVQAIEETSVVRISGPNFKDMVARIPSLAEQTMLRLCALSRFLCERAFESRAFSVPDQIRLEIQRVLSMYPHEDGELTIESAPTHEEIARRVCTTREQVTRVMGEFAKRGLITQSRKSWHLRDVSAVREELVSGMWTEIGCGFLLYLTSSDSRHLAQRVQRLRGRHIGLELWPRGGRNLADIDIAT